MNKKFTALAALSMAGALVLAGCSNAADSGNAGNSAEGGGTNYIIGYGSEPESPLLPGDTNETGGGRILTMIGSSLFYYDADGVTHPDLAESVTSDDSQVYTVVLKKGQKFSDGTEVKAENFTKAWNYAVKESLKQASFFSSIKGFEEGKEMEGLEVVDDYTFKVTLAQPEADWPLRLGYSAYQPMADSAFTDIKAYGENPPASGPYKVSKWNHNEDILLVPNETYTGPRKPMNDGVKLKFYPELPAAYTDLIADNLDVLDAIPDIALTTFKTELGDRAVNKPSALFYSFTIDTDEKHFAGEEGKLRRQAISMAINRPEITEKIFNNVKSPAKDFTAPVLQGYSDSIKGSEVLAYNPDKAKELWAQANAISPWEGQFKLAYNSDGGHQSWVDAVANSIKNTLEIDAVGEAYPDFKSLRTKVSKHEMETAYRTGWLADYPSQYNFLAPIYATGGSSNDGNYSNPEFDKLLKEGLAAKNVEDALAKFTQAQEILMQDLPAIPLWYSNSTGGYSTKVQNVTVGWDSNPLYYQITKK
ncbi:peptide ABC transporter substrate-binding protein [Boudabousia marimammalium]|uniref:ABC transporter substrate-binding protein n=1 Tax=Boudabousia marimammalium TaxID=156892 RepID=A0A1Q5PMA1_9ACTO|nr:ABC transporter substrate-binding protein [Boudabousia marimammalium]OKL48649.1 ABC transporter substrate-binding protein [Boudabousia marimammalium]